VEKDNLDPLDDWGQLKNLTKLTFKPANSIIILRDQLHQLQQKRTISEYIREFLKIKLSISNIKDEEAVSQFVRGLKDPELKLKINRLYRGDNCPPLNEAINEAYLHESSNHAVFYPGFQNSRTIIDDPMDLSVAYQHNSFRGRGGFRDGFCGGFSRGGRGGNVSGPPRGDYYVSHRGNFRGGGFPGGFSNRGYHSSAPRGRGAGSLGGGGPPRVCYTCGEPGHIQYYCPRNNQNQKLNYMHSDNGNNDYYNNGYYDDYGYNYNNEYYHDATTVDNKNNNSNNKDKRSSNYSDARTVSLGCIPKERSGSYLNSEII
jgi:hypothetical protein